MLLYRIKLRISQSKIVSNKNMRISIITSSNNPFNILI